MNREALFVLYLGIFMIVWSGIFLLLEFFGVAITMNLSFIIIAGLLMVWMLATLGWWKLWRYFWSIPGP